MTPVEHLRKLLTAVDFLLESRGKWKLLEKDYEALEDAAAPVRKYVDGLVSPPSAGEEVK